VGEEVGKTVWPSRVGAEVVGYLDGAAEGRLVGAEVVGLTVGWLDGWVVGRPEGWVDG